AVRDDLDLQRLVLETCRGLLSSHRVGNITPGSLSCEVGGGLSSRGGAGGLQGSGPQDEIDANRAGRALVKRLGALGPLILKEFFRQLQEGNTSSAAAANASGPRGKKGKAKGAG
ncbi:unnamed protein product, partial [Discosporangium mesarthrocarpum]